MKKINILTCVFGMGLVVACAGISFASAQTVYPQRVLIQRHSLLGQAYVSFFNWFGFKAPDPVPVNNPYNSSGVTSAPAQRGPVAQPGSFSPVANGISPTTRGPVGSGGGSSCSGSECCGSNTTFSNGACVASCGGGSGNTTGNECLGDNECGNNESCVYDCTPMIKSDQKKYCRVTADIKACLIKCLSSASRISTPIGDVAVTSLTVGNIVWTADAAGNRIVRSLIRVSRVPAANHRVVHLILADGRTLDVSAPHPTADGRTVGDLTAGGAYDGSTVRSAVLKAYEGSATYDILPAGDTGYYWANGILMGSTLK